MPGAMHLWLPREDVLTFEEISRLARLFGELGVDRLRLTGGEPLLRRNVPDLIRRLAAKKQRPISRSRTASCWPSAPLSAARRRLHRVTVSLDTLSRDRFQRLANRPAWPPCSRASKRPRRAFPAISDRYGHHPRRQ